MSAVSRPTWQKALITLSFVVTVSAIVTMLYIARAVLIPIAMAIFFTSVLTPVVKFLQLRGFGRTPAVVLSVLTAVLVFLGTSFLITRELTNLSDTIAAHRDNIKTRIEQSRTSILGTEESSLSKLIDDLGHWSHPENPESPQSTVLEPRQSTLMPSLTAIVGPAVEVFGQIAFSFVLLIFMLLARVDLADRMMWLVGEGRMTVTTRAMQEANERLSRYLFRQFMVNVSFGVVVALILSVVGLEYAFLWGFLTAIMRYVPFIGTWIAVIPPALFAIAVGDSWTLPITTVGVILGLEIIVGSFLEPLIYGKSLGVSEVAQLISAAIWSFLWGPVGLILASPITTCLLVLGRHAPPLRFLEVLLSTRPALTPPMALFQRLASQDQDEALRLLQQTMKSQEPDELIDDVLVPALKQLKTARVAGEFDAAEDAQITRITKEVFDETLDDLRRTPNGNEALEERVRLLAAPAQDEFDRMALDALVSRLPLSQWQIRVSSVTTLTAELLADAATFDPQVIVIGSLPPGGSAHARYLCKRLRQQFPNARLIVGRWCDDEVNAAEWTAAGSDEVQHSLRATLKHLTDWKPVLASAEVASERTRQTALTESAA